MKKLFTLTLFFLFHASSAQISFFKDLNTTEEGSYPANFTEINGTTFFTVKDVETHRLWKTDGTENGTVQVSDQAISIKLYNFGVPNLYTFNNELYYFVENIGISSAVSLWKTDGNTKSLVSENIWGTTKLHFLNNQVYFFFNGVLYRVEDGLNIPIKTVSNYFGNIAYRPYVINNQLFFFTYDLSYAKLTIWKSDGTEAGTTIIKEIDNMTNMSVSSEESFNRALAINNELFFITGRYIFGQSGGIEKIVYEVWKTNGEETEIIKTLDSNSFGLNYEITNLANFNQQLIFTFRYTQLWISDGTPNGTKQLKAFDAIYPSSKKWAFLNNKFYFSASNNQQSELWESDGTETGTTLVKNLNSSTDITPDFFHTINNRIIFRVNNNELWQSDGTSAGTSFVATIPAPVEDVSVKAEFIYTSNNTLLFANYDAQHNYELWKSDGTIQNTALLKNINTNNKGSLASDKKIKMGNTWFFNGRDHRGGELWKTDGTPEGTAMVKDLNLGVASTIIQEVVRLGNTVYFTARFTNEYYSRLFKSDGTEAGTVEIPLSSSSQNPVNPYKLVVTTDKLFFIGADLNLWVSNGTQAGTHAMQSLTGIRAASITAVGNKVFFEIFGTLWVSDGTQANTFQVSNPDANSLGAHRCLIEFKNKLYFFASYFRERTLELYESDGTIAGTKSIKKFDVDVDITSTSSLLFLEKTTDRLYFRVAHNKTLLNESFDLWASDGTAQGTYPLKTISIDGAINAIFTNINSQLYIINKSFLSYSDLSIWTSDGTAQGTYLISKKAALSNRLPYIAFYDKLFFSYYDLQYGTELFSTDKSKNSFDLIGEVRNGSKDSFVKNFMDLDDKLLFWANDETRGEEIWQYVPMPCEGNRNISTKSGSWASPDTWTCGRIPSADDVVIIKSEHTVALPPNYNAFAKFLTTQTGAVLDVPNSSTLLVKP